MLGECSPKIKCVVPNKKDIKYHLVLTEVYVSNIETAILKAEQRCRDRGSRLTPRRRQVLQALIEAGEPVSAYGLLEMCNTQDLDAMPAMSMYRILDYLVEQQLAHRLVSSKKYVACSHINCCTEHFQRTHFLICSECSQVREVEVSEALIASLSGLAGAEGFHLSSRQLEFSGVCNECH